MKIPLEPIISDLLGYSIEEMSKFNKKDWERVAQELRNLESNDKNKPTK